MNDVSRSPSTDEVLNNLNPRDIAALYLGYRQLLENLQDFQLSGKRAAGGLATRLETASLMLSATESALERLAMRDPQKVADVLEYLQFAPPSVDRVRERLQESLHA